MSDFMSEDEQVAWVRMLGATPEAQRAVIVDLLRHANEDAMSVEDRRICRRQLDRLADVSSARVRRRIHRVQPRREVASV